MYIILMTTTQNKTFRKSNWLVIVTGVDGRPWFVPANNEAEARATAARFAARGVTAEACIAA